MPQVHFALARQVQIHLEAISWRQVNPQGPVPGERGSHSAAYDPESNSMVVLWGSLLLSVASVSVFCILSILKIFLSKMKARPRWLRQKCGPRFEQKSYCGFSNSSGYDRLA